LDVGRNVLILSSTAGGKRSHWTQLAEGCYAGTYLGSIKRGGPLPVHVPPLPSHTSSLRSRLSLIQLGDLEERCKLSSGSGRSPAAKRYLVHFELKNASGKSNFKYIFMKNSHKFDKLKRKFSVYE